MMPRFNRHLPRLALAAAALLGCSLAAAGASRSFHTFRVSEVFTSVDGAVQFVELRETFNLNFQHQFLGHVLTATSADGTQTNTYSITTNLPNTSTSGKRVLFATANFGGLTGGVTPDYVIPPNFLFIGGTVDFDVVSSVDITGLPTNGAQSLSFPGGAGPNSPTNYLSPIAGSVNVPSGACCVGAACTLASAPGCAGTFSVGVLCASNPCGAGATGACCNGAACAVQTAANCSGGQTYQGDGSACGATGNPTTCCKANHNQAGGVTVQDIFDFLADYFNNDVAADFNGVGGITVQDIFDFLAAYFNGCPG